MQTASKILQILALGACFAAQVHGALAMPGMRRALQTMEAAGGLPAHAALAGGWVLSSPRP